MLDIKFIRESPDAVRQNLQKRNHSGVDVDQLLAQDGERRKLLFEVEQLRAEQNKASAEIAKVKKEKGDIAQAVAATKTISEKLKSLGEVLKEKEAALNEKLLEVPNMLHDSLPVGADESASRVERVWGEAPRFDFEHVDHVDLGEKLDILDFERAAKIARARFCVSKGAGARLERALINFMLDIHTEEHGYTEMLPPLAVNSETMLGTGQLPKFAEDLFRLENVDLWLIPTAEVPLTYLYGGEILEADRLPIYLTAFTPCFRSEAGSYGKDTRGMLRQHQFNKVELVKICKPGQSWDELEKLTANAETILQRLGLHYRVVTLPTGDTGFNAAKTYDLEVWLPGQGAYREISSCSLCGDFQARRMNARYRPDGEKATRFVHTLNGSGVATGRALIAVMENYQNGDGSIAVPDVLQPYMGGTTRIG